MRDPNRQAPHNAFVSTTSIRDVLRQRGGPIKATLGPLNVRRLSAGPAAGDDDQDPVPGPGGLQRRVRLRRRPEGLQAHHGRPAAPDGSTGDQYTATSIVVEFADVELIPNDDAGRVDVGLVGSGKGVLIAEGTQVPLQWSRASVRDATQFKRTDGAPFVVPSGQVWIQIVPLETQLSMS